MIEVAVLLTVFNRKEKTLACLQNLFTQELTKDTRFTVYLVDDGSTDGTSETVKATFSSVKIIKGTGDLFWNRGMYLAWQTALNDTMGHDFYLWLNDDTILSKNALKILLNCANVTNNQAIIIGTTSALEDSTKVTYGGRDCKETLIMPSEEMKPCDCFNGNIVLIPNSVYQKVGTNDPCFHHALGDFDYGLRAKKNGLAMYVAPGILGRCDVHNSLAVWCNPDETFTKRWKTFRSPLGNNPEEFFIFQKRHKGLTRAVFNYLTNHLRVFFPSIWKLRCNK
ncbi:glycosyltransferase family 2 protein [Wenyingzhuangia sp. IMCC45574]